jgi:hypothetical protein
MNPTENNRLIAEFMGAKYNPKQNRHEGVPIPNSNSVANWNVEILPYNSSWDWLMPVVGKLSNQCEEPEELDNLRMCLLCNDIEGAYSEVVSLIENL